MNFTKDLIHNADIDSGNVRVGLVIYSTRVHIQFHLGSHNTKSAILDAIEKVPYITGNTNTADGLATIGTSMFVDKNGDRPDVENIAILVTDGQSNINSRRTMPEAVKLRDSGIKIFSVGIGLTQTQEIRQISSLPHAKYMFTAEDFNRLEDIKEHLFKSFCGGLYLIIYNKYI